MDLNIFWFVLLGVLLAGYAILDGFDLGVGILHPVAKTDLERRTILNSIGPIWDGNEVWLVTFGGALFAAFPEAYATVFSGFYTAFMLLLLALIFRAVSLEFRSKVQNARWRHAWDHAFFGASLLATLLFGVAVGNAMYGVPLNARGIYVGTFFDLLNWYALLCGALAVALFSMHGSIYLYLKTEGALQERIHHQIWRTFGFFLVLYFLVTIATLVAVPRSLQNFDEHPWAWIVVVLNVLAVANVPRAIYQRRPVYAFVSSSATIAALVFLFGIALFPALVTGREIENSLTIYNAASSQKTLTIMAFIAGLGMPFVVAYTVVIYWTFRGKVKVGPHSY
ncbi:cytochrome d ubiquinol oxidase subunit II [Vulgatibacter sp.]|uniref:cytochrome d ubiquinol oxidase subunit II n=1 Tax=Vulgatibacter sp. TaxID=1971226 RepID=UPI003561D852